MLAKIGGLSLLMMALNMASLAHDNYYQGQSKAKTMIAEGKIFHQSIDLIRKMHPEFLLHKRDKTLREGVRSDEDSLKGCVHCHASENQNNELSQNPYHPINDPDQFCSICHQKVAVSIDCFACHRATPELTEPNKQ